MSQFAFFTSYANVFSGAAHLQQPALGDLAAAKQASGVAGILIQSALLMGIMLTLARRWCMPFGSWTLLITLHLLLAVSPHEDWRLLPGGIFTGLFADVLTQRIGASHVFALSVPFVLYALLFATLMLSGGLIWSMSLWLGGILLAGVVGVLMHMFIAPTSAYTSPLP